MGLSAALTLMLVATASLMACASAWHGKPDPVFEKVEFALMAAYLPEYENTLALLSGKLTNYTFGGRLFTTGVIADDKKTQTAVVTMMGIGMTNAAMTAQMTILLFRPKFIFNTGIAGGIDPDTRIGDVVVAKNYVDPDYKKVIRPAYDGAVEFGVFSDPGTDFPNKFYTEAGKTPGQFGIEYPPNFDFTLPKPNSTFLAQLEGASTVSTMYSIPMEVEVLKSVADTFMLPTPPTMFDLPAANRILKVAERILPGIVLARGAGGAELPYQPIAKVVDRCVSSNTFIDNAQMRKAMHSLYNITCCEMEGHAILHVCLSNKVKCAIVRSISDLAGGEPGQAGASELGTFFAIAATNTAMVAKALVLSL
jgi:adenosylhomocysteine nucleosidase